MREKMMTYKELKKKVRAFANMHPGLGLPGETAPSEDTIATACFWIRLCSELGLDVDASPGDFDSITVIPMKGDMCAQLIVSGDKLFSLEIQKGFGLHFEELLNVDDPDIHDVLNAIIDLAMSKAETTCGKRGEPTEWINMPESSIQTNTYQDVDDTKVTHLQYMGTQSRSSNSAAPKKKAPQYAPISDDFTQEYAKVVNL